MDHDMKYRIVWVDPETYEIQRRSWWPFWEVVNTAFSKERAIQLLNKRKEYDQHIKSVVYVA